MRSTNMYYVESKLRQKNVVPLSISNKVFFKQNAYVNKQHYQENKRYCTNSNTEYIFQFLRVCLNDNSTFLLICIKILNFIFILMCPTIGLLTNNSSMLLFDVKKLKATILVFGQNIFTPTRLNASILESVRRFIRTVKTSTFIA